MTVKHASVCVILVALCFLAGCRNEEQPIPPGQVAFSFARVEGSGSSGGRKQQETPAYVSFVLRKPDGTSVSGKRSLTEFNGSYITQPEQLIPGDYALTQFFILDNNEHSVYASPVSGTDLADLVEHPLPLPFTVSSEQTTHIVPEVIAIEDHTAEDFGYVTLSFNVINVKAIQVPVIEDKSITKISYEFRRGAERIASEYVTLGRVANINDNRLVNGEWQSRILVWVDSDGCAKDVYRFEGSIVFQGALVKLPDLTDGRWALFRHRQMTVAANTAVDIFLSTDPRTAFRIEMSAPAAVGIRGYFDRTYWDSNDVQLCATTKEEFYGVSSVAATMDDSPACSAEPGTQIDSIVSFTLNDQQPPFQAYFAWEIQQGGGIVPVCN